MLAVYTKSEREISLFLNGGILGGVDLRNEGVRYLHGLTLIFTAPSSTTVTFAATPASAQVALTITQILTQIETQMSNAVIARINQGGVLEIIETTPTDGVVITAAGTANARLGFSVGQATSGKVYAPPDGTAPRVLGINPSLSNGHFLVFTEEP